MFIPSSATTFPIILFSLLLQSASDALKCKCTQASPKVPCLDGVCEVPTANSACLVLDHPTSGLHYACSTNANLSEGECVSKISKSGANVKVCSCFSSNFCNFKIWPGGQEVPDDDEGEEDEDSGDEEEDEEGFTAGRGRGSRGGAINSATTDMPPVVRRLLLVTMGVVCLLTFPLLLPLPNIH